jgi:hypothetical protein
MRRFILVAALAAVAPISFAFAQGQAQAPANPAPPAAPPMAAPNPDSCGTPDEPKACPPMPRHALKHYRAKKQPSG